MEQAGPHGRRNDGPGSQRAGKDGEASEVCDLPHQPRLPHSPTCAARTFENPKLDPMDQVSGLANELSRAGTLPRPETRQKSNCTLNLRKRGVMMVCGCSQAPVPL